VSIELAHTAGAFVISPLNERRLRQIVFGKKRESRLRSKDAWLYSEPSRSVFRPHEGDSTHGLRSASGFIRFSALGLKLRAALKSEGRGD
jgi:hypothetical protein